VNVILADLLNCSPSTTESLSDRDYIEMAYREFVAQLPPEKFHPTETPKPTLPAGELYALQCVGLAIDEQANCDAAQARKVAREVWFHVFRSALSTGQVAEMLGVGVSRIRQRIRERTLLALKNGREVRVPGVQFEAGVDVPGLRRVLPNIPVGIKPLEVLSWLVTPTSDLEDTTGRPRSPREYLLDSGDAETVLALVDGLHSGDI
jgi:excisionase family DNA binding protein